MSHPERHVECTIPVLRVRDLQRSIRFYTDMLGFNLDWGGEAGKIICSVSRDGCSIVLLQSDETDSPAWVWIGLQDDSLFDVYKARGVTVHQEPQNHSWGYEMKFRDPDGNVLWFGTGTRKDLPLEDS